MTLVTTRYRPKRAPRKKRKGPPIANRTVTPAKLKPLKGPVIRLGAASNLQPAKAAHPGPVIVMPAKPTRRLSAAQQRCPVMIVEPKRKRSYLAAMLDDITPEELQRRCNAADALWRELVGRAALPERD